MSDTNRREFFRNVILAGAALAVSGTSPITNRAEATEKSKISGICIYVPTLGKAGEFVELMNKSAPGDWQVEALEGSFNDRYFQARALYKRARSDANTFVGVVDPASFTIINEAVADSGGSFHYVTYQERGRVTFSVRL